jgi:FG-GAP repeat
MPRLGESRLRMLKTRMAIFAASSLFCLLAIHPLVASAATASATTFVELQKVTSDDGATDDQFGWSVAVEGNVALVGAPNTTIGANQAQGSVYVFRKMAGVWVQTQKLTAMDGKSGDAFGISVALSGSIALIGAPNTETFRGSVYVFEISSGSWVQTQKLSASDGAEFNQFGWSIAQNGRRALIGAIGATFGTTSSQGAVYAFTNDNGTWDETQKFSSADGASGDGFGWSVAFDGKSAVVGPGFVTVNGNDFQGAAYTFQRNGNVWTQTDKLIASNGDAFDFFGLAVAIEGRTVLIGAEGAATDGNPFSNQGVVYRFKNSAGVWTQTQIVAASAGQPSDSFGHSVALKRGRALIGASGVAVGGTDFAGASYVFEKSDGLLVEVQKLTPSDPVENGLFGWSSAISGGDFFNGAYNATAGGNDRQGAVYINGPESGAVP